MNTIELQDDGRYFIYTMVTFRVKAFVHADSESEAFDALDEALGEIVFTDTKVDESFVNDYGHGEAWSMETPQRWGT